LPLHQYQTTKRMKKNYLLLSAFMVLAFFVVAQPLAEAPPESVKMSSERLQRIGRVIQEYVDSSYIPGAVALVARHGKIVYHESFGYADVESRQPLRQDAIFRIASQTKAITSVAVMMLYEEGRFLLDDPVSKYIPAFKNPQVIDQYNAADTSYTTVPAKREVTIRDLLAHTSGIGYAGIGTPQANAIYAKHDIPSGLGTPNGNLGEAIERLGALPLMHQPGERWTYGLNTDVLGYLVEVVSGKTLDEFFHQRIFQPLGMADTWFYLPADKHRRLVRLHAENPDKKAAPYPNGGSPDPDFPKFNGSFYSGGAGLSSTVYDYAVFLQMLLNGGEYQGVRLLSPAIVRMMTSNQIGELNLGVRKFGLGFGLATPAEAARLPPSEGTFEWGGAFATSYWVDPQEGIVGLIYTQKYPNSYGDLAAKFRVLVYQAITELEGK
jgi:CubicO group peptidase (beta-lactamase class C family)